MQIVQEGGYSELRVDGKPFFVNSASFFYPRVPRRLWEASLDSYRELGINTIEISIPWNWHEPREGEFDFDGHTNPRRDLRALLRMITDRGFRLSARPGPTGPREWRNLGYPDWLLARPEYHMPLADRLEGRAPPAAEIAAVDAEGAARLWLENPVHMTYAAKWLEAVARELAPYRASVALRIEAHNSGEAKKRVTEQELSGPLLFVQVGGGPGSGNAGTAGPEFWKYAEGLCSVLHHGGVDVPCFVDAAPLRAAGAGAALAAPVAAMGQWFLPPLGGHSAEQRRISPLDVARLESTVASLTSQPDFPPVLAEFDAGWFAPQDDARPELSPPQNVEIAGHLLLGYGVRGFSWFPLQDSLTPAGFETPDASRFYRWDAPFSVSLASQRGELAATRMGEWLQAWGEQLAASHRRADVGLVDTTASLPREKLTGADAAAIARTLEQIERLAEYAGLSSESVDPEFQPVAQLLRHALILFPVYGPAESADALSFPAQRALDAYVRSGGELVCFPAAPPGAVFDGLQRGPSADARGLPAGTRAWRAGAGRFVVLTKDFYSWVPLDEDFPAAMTSLEAPFAVSLLGAILTDAGVRPAVRGEGSKTDSAELVASELVTNGGTLPLGKRAGGQAWLSVVNLSNDRTVSETLEALSPSAPAQMAGAEADDWLPVTVTLPPRQSLLLPVNERLCRTQEAGRDCSDRVISAGAELVRAERDGKSMYLLFDVPAKASVRLHLADRPGHVDVDDVPVSAQWIPARQELVVDLLRGASPYFLHLLRIQLNYRPALPERPEPETRHLTPAHIRFSPAGAARLALGEDEALLTNPPLFILNRGSDGWVRVVAENRGGQGDDVQVSATGPLNASARAFVGGYEIRGLNLKVPASAIQSAAAEPPAADGLYHGTLHLAASAGIEDVPAAYAIVPEKGTIHYWFDFDADGSAEYVLENAAARAIFSPASGGRLIALVLKSPEKNVTSSMGLLEDVFSFTPNPPGASGDEVRGRAGMFNRSYAADWQSGAGGPAVRLTYDAPDVYPHGARIEKTARFAEDRQLEVEYHVSLLPGDARRLEEEAAGKIFAAPPPGHPVPQSFEILNSVPARSEGPDPTEFCWTAPQGTTGKDASGEHCEDFVPGGAAIAVPANVRQIEVRQPRSPGLAMRWEDAGARLTLEPKNFSVVLRLVFPPLSSGGAAEAYRIEFSMKEAQ